MYIVVMCVNQLNLHVRMERVINEILQMQIEHIVNEIVLFMIVLHDVHHHIMN